MERSPIPESVLVRRRRIRLLVIALISSTLLAYCYGPIGYVAVKMQCSRDGGVQVTRTDFARGIYVYTDQLLCDQCIGLVSDGLFEFAEADSTLRPLRGAGRQPSRLHRFSISSDPDASCLRHRGHENRTDIPCVVAEDIDRVTAKYALRELNPRKVPGPLDVQLEMSGFEIEALDTHEVIGRYRAYVYSPVAYIAAGAGGGYGCDTEGVTRSSFLRRVLRDESKR